MNNDVVIYQSSDGLVKMEAIVDASNETIWATQKAMAELFGVTVPNISYHFKRIFASGELDAQTVIKEILITAQSGVRGVSEEKIRYYNLDAILSLGYRVNSVQATAFRKWATSVLKQYMIKGYAVNQNAVSEQKYEDLKRALGLLENVHSFVDGNKRIAATLFLWFLQNNGILYRPDGAKRIADGTLVALTLMIAESRMDEMDILVKVVVNLINRKQ